MLHVTRWKCRTQKLAKKSPNLSGHIFATKARSNNRKKNLLSSNIFSTCPRSMVNFGLLTAEIDPVVWGTSANFNGFRVLAALLHGTLVLGVSQTAALNRWRHLYSTGRPSRWALAHVLVFVVLSPVVVYMKTVTFAIRAYRTTIIAVCCCIVLYHWCTGNRCRQN